jgi:hypothetical protein
MAVKMDEPAKPDETTETATGCRIMSVPVSCCRVGHDNGLGFMNGLVKRLHPQGAHHGLSDESDSTVRLHMVLLTARLLLVRYDVGLLKGKPWMS